LKETYIFHGDMALLSNLIYELKNDLKEPNLVIRSWSVAFPHVTDCPKGEVDVVAIRALPIIITPSS
jgi:hypothetical protein